MPRMTMVITTINVPVLLEAYQQNFEKYGHLGEADCVVVGDLKTPHEEVRAVQRKCAEGGFSFSYLHPEVQEKHIGWSELCLPWNSDCRRNLGYLWAVERGAEVIVCVDDDNWPGEDDWYAGHALVGQTLPCDTISDQAGWFNPCDLITTQHCYARGYPYFRRNQPSGAIIGKTLGRVVMNGGMWMNDPDVDSITRLAKSISTYGLSKDRIMLAPGTWAPVNTQNTAFHKDLLPSFFFPPMGGRICGLPVERYGDIWAGYFAQKLMEKMGDSLTFGLPTCIHKRNAHNLLKDLELEFWAILLTEQLVEKLREWPIFSTTYSDGYLELADHLERAEWKHEHREQIRAFFGEMAKAMRRWVGVCRKLA